MKDTDGNLIPTKLEDVKDELIITSENGEDVELKASEYVVDILNFDNTEEDKKNEAVGTIEDFGLDLQKESAAQSRMLKGPLRDLSKRGDEGSDVSNSLINLKSTVEDLDPTNFNFEAGWLTRTLGFLPFIGTPLKKYFTKFESAQVVINTIINSLKNGSEQLRRDNITLREDQNRMKDLIKRLSKSIHLGQSMDQKMMYSLERELVDEIEKKKFIEQELLFPLRQRVIDLQQQLAVNQQGVIAAEIIIRNNKELIRGVNRALNVTISALEVAVTTAMALNEQKIVLEKVNALNSTTNELIANNAKRLRTQGVEIQRQAASSSINMDVLKEAFRELSTALDDLASFRTEALPQMATSILEMNSLISKSEKSIKDIDKSNSARSKIKIEL